MPCSREISSDNAEQFTVLFILSVIFFIAYVYYTKVIQPLHPTSAPSQTASPSQPAKPSPAIHIPAYSTPTLPPAAPPEDQLRDRETHLSLIRASLANKKRDIDLHFMMKRQLANAQRLAQEKQNVLAEKFWSDYFRFLEGWREADVDLTGPEIQQLTAGQGRQAVAVVEGGQGGAGGRGGSPAGGGGGGWGGVPWLGDDVEDPTNDRRIPGGGWVNALGEPIRN